MTAPAATTRLSTRLWPKLVRRSRSIYCASVTVCGHSRIGDCVKSRSGRIEDSRSGGIATWESAKAGFGPWLPRIHPPTGVPVEVAR